MGWKAAVAVAPPSLLHGYCRIPCYRELVKVPRIVEKPSVVPPCGLPACPRALSACFCFLDAQEPHKSVSVGMTHDQG